MSEQIWSWLLTLVGLVGFFLAGRKVWWCWYINIANQILWFTYATITEQWGFILGAFAYLFVFTKNAIAWTREHREHRLWQGEAYRDLVTYSEKDVELTMRMYKRDE